MNRLKRGAGDFVYEFETRLVGLLGYYMITTMAMLCALGGLRLAEWMWPRADEIQVVFAVIGLTVGGLAGLFGYAAIMERYVEKGRMGVLWLALGFIPGAALPVVIVRAVVWGLRRWSEGE